MSDDPKIKRITELVDNAQASLHAASRLLHEITGMELPKEDYNQKASSLGTASVEGENTIIEGVFNGETVNDKTGKEYPVPANYASKSKLVPGDVLKLTIKPDGSFIYKQIGPVPRTRVIGTLTYEDGLYKVIANGKAFKVILASVTYFKGSVGDKVTLIIPEHEDSEWGAIENIIPQDLADESEDL